MEIDYRRITKRQALRPYKKEGELTQQEAALARDLSCATTTVSRWEMDGFIPKPWGIIVVNLLFPELFKKQG